MKVTRKRRFEGEITLSVTYKGKPRSKDSKGDFSLTALVELPEKKDAVVTFGLRSSKLTPEGALALGDLMYAVVHECNLHRDKIGIQK